MIQYSGIPWKAMNLTTIMAIFHAAPGYKPIGTVDGCLIVQDRKSLHFSAIPVDPEYWEKQPPVATAKDIWQSAPAHYESWDHYLDGIDIFAHAPGYSPTAHR